MSAAAAAKKTRVMKQIERERELFEQHADKDEFVRFCGSLQRSSNPWTTKGATISDKNAQKEFGLTHEEIVDAVVAGKLQSKRGTSFGNAYMKLVRFEVETLVKELRGGNALEKKKLQKELGEVKKELSQIEKQKKILERRRDQLAEKLGVDAGPPKKRQRKAKKSA